MNIPLNIDWQQILLHVLNFVILFGGLYFLLYKPVKNFMAKREAHYAEMAQKAQSELDSAEKPHRKQREQHGGKVAAKRRRNRVAQRFIPPARKIYRGRVKRRFRRRR